MCHTNFLGEGGEEIMTMYNTSAGLFDFLNKPDTGTGLFEFDRCIDQQSRVRMHFTAIQQFSDPNDLRNVELWRRQYHNIELLTYTTPFFVERIQIVLRKGFRRERSAAAGCAQPGILPG